MGDYLHLFETENEFQSAYTGESYREPWVSYTKQAERVDYNKAHWKPNANGHEYVDLGLPSGTLWATHNVGAQAITDKGDNFSWSDPTVRTGGGEANQYYNNGTWTKYNESDGLIYTEMIDDAARVHMGGDWQIPTYEQWTELTGNTDKGYRVVIDGVTGYKFTSRQDSSVFIFLPVTVTGMNEAYYHTNRLHQGNFCWQFYAYGNTISIPADFRRLYPSNVRGVLTPPSE